MSKQSNSGNAKNFKPGDRVRFSGKSEVGLYNDFVYLVSEVDKFGFLTVIDGDGDARYRGKDEWEKVEDAAKAPQSPVQGDLTGEGSPGASAGVEASGGAVAGRDTVTLERMTEDEAAAWDDAQWVAWDGNEPRVIAAFRTLGIIKPEPVIDTTLLIAREICAQMMLERYNPDLGQELAEHYRAGAYDDGNEMTIALRALEKGKQSC